jgi:hypothetical protein
VSASEELLQRRKDAAERKRQSRANKKEREAEENERAAERYFLREQLVGRGQVRHGCPSAGVNGTNNDACPLKTCPHMAGTSIEAMRDEYLFCARRWAVAAGVADVQLGESIESFEKRVYKSTTKKVSGHWESLYLSLRTGSFDPTWFATFEFDPNDSPTLPHLAAPLDKEDINELPEVKSTTHVDSYMAALEENRKRIAFEQRTAKEEAEGVQRQLEEAEARKLMSPMAVSLKMAGEQ